MPLHVTQCNASASGRSAQCVINPYCIGGIAGSTKVNRIGRKTAYAMLVILLVAIVWQVLGSP
jgi:hypothetical protein